MSAACWLMDRLGVGEAVIGDLVEQVRAGRSRAWFWRQAFGAIGAGLVSDIRTHPVLVLRAVVIGLLLRQAIIAWWGWVEPEMDSWVGRQLLDVFDLHRPMLIFNVSLVNTLITMPGWCFTGWCVARFHRPRVALVLVAALWGLMLPHYARQIHHALTDPTFGRYRTVHIVTLSASMGAFTLSVLAGALLKSSGPAGRRAS
jgi:hypothetical protein